MNDSRVFQLVVPCTSIASWYNQLKNVLNYYPKHLISLAISGSEEAKCQPRVLFAWQSIHPSVLFCLFKLLSWRSYPSCHAVRGELHPRHVPLCLRGDTGRHTTTHVHTHTQFKAPVILTGLWAVRGSRGSWENMLTPQRKAPASWWIWTSL